MQKSKLMFYLAGYIIACFALISGLGYGLSVLYKRSAFKPAAPSRRTPPEIRSHALISFSIILPFSALAFLFLTFAAMKIAATQGSGHHLQFVATSMLLPTACFIVGYFYFKKAVGS